MKRTTFNSHLASSMGRTCSTPSSNTNFANRQRIRTVAIAPTRPTQESKLNKGPNRKYRTRQLQCTSKPDVPVNTTEHAWKNVEYYQPPAAFVAIMETLYADRGAG